MNKKVVVLAAGGILLLLLIWIGAVAAGIAGEASKADGFLKDAIAKHLSQADINNSLKAMGFEMTDGARESHGSGPVHSPLFYSTHLTVTLGFDSDNKSLSYHLDRM